MSIARKTVSSIYAVRLPKALRPSLTVARTGPTPMAKYGRTIGNVRRNSSHTPQQRAAIKAASNIRMISPPPRTQNK